MNVTLIGVDLAKSVFQLCAVNQAGKVIFNRSVRRAQLLGLLLKYPDATVAMEACSGSNYWGRTLLNTGMNVKLIPTQHVKPFVKGNKNDRNDAFAITEAARRPHLICVPPRTLAQTDLALVHRVRKRWVDQRTALMNQIRGMLNEYGIVISRGKYQLATALPQLIDDPNNDLCPAIRSLFDMVFQEWQVLDQRIKQLDTTIKRQATEDQDARRLLAIKGISYMTATAAIAHVGSAQHYRSGRHLSASLGLVPNEHSSGGKQKLGAITKRGNEYLRHLLIQGAWSILRYVDRSEDQLSRWARKLVARRGKHKAVVAVANKLARIIWALLAYKRDYQPDVLPASA